MTGHFPAPADPAESEIEQAVSTIAEILAAW